MSRAAEARRCMDELIGAIRATPTPTGEFRIPKRQLLTLLEKCRKWMVDEPPPLKPRPRYVAYQAPTEGGKP